MPLYRVNESGRFLPFEETPFPDLERVLEDWIEANPHLLLHGETIAFIGRQPRTQHGKFLDLLGVDESGACVIVELKRGETPRDVVAQALEYAAWVDTLTLEQLDDMARKYALEHKIDASSVAEMYHHTFASTNSDEEDLSFGTDHITFNSRQRLVIVAERFSGEIEQTIRYLRTRMGFDITGLQFNIHKAGNDKIVQTNVIVGREITTVAPKPPGGTGAIQSESNESILARVKTEFVQQAVSSIENWIDRVGNSDLIVRHGPQSEHFIRFRGKTQAYYYYAQKWLYCVLYNASSLEEDALRTRLSKPTEVIQTSPGYVRFHIATDADLEILKEAILRRVRDVSVA
jgi:hypothetical protein